MNCHELQQKMWSSGISEEIKVHLEVCANCRDEFRVFRGIFEKLNDNQTPMPSKSLKPSPFLIRRVTKKNKMRKTVRSSSLVAGIAVALLAGSSAYLYGGIGQHVEGGGVSKSSVTKIQTTVPPTKPVSNAAQPDPQEAIQRVLNIRGNEFPSQPGKIEGTITWANPSFSKSIPAQLETEISKTDNAYVVTLTETWKSSDFYHDANNKVPDSGQTKLLTHYWKYKVTENDTTLLEDKGDYPPQYTN